MIRASLIFILTFTLVLGAEDSRAIESNAVIQVLPEVYLDQDQIRLSDILKGQNLDKSTQAQLAKIVVGSAPKEGEVRVFTSYAISEIMRFNLKESLSGISLRIPNEIRIFKKESRITSDLIKEKIMENAMKSCEACEIQIEALRLPDLKLLPKDITWELSNTRETPRGSFNVAIDIYKNNNFYKKIFVQGHLKISKVVPVFARNLSTNTKIQKDDFVLEKRDITFDRDISLTEEEVLGAELAKNVMANQIIWKSSLKRKMALRRGDPVQVIIENPSWSIRLSGVAQDNGYIGDMAKVLNPISKKIILGVIKSEDLVEVR